MTKPILDACCGGRMFWFDKNNPHAVFGDNRSFDTTLCDGRPFSVKPDIIMDFKEIPYPDESFYMVVYDPPHLLKVGETSWLNAKYGGLPEAWEEEINQGFDECWRVLRPGGTLVFKWSDVQIPTSDVLKAIGRTPTVGDKRSKTRWMIFFKAEGL